MESSHVRSKTVTIHKYTRESETPFAIHQNRNLRLMSALKKRHLNTSSSSSYYFSNKLIIEGHSRFRPEHMDKPTTDKDKDGDFKVKELPIPGYSRLLASLRVKGSRYNAIKTAYKPFVLETSFSNKKILPKETFSPIKYDISNPFTLNQPKRDNIRSAPILKRVVKRRHLSEVFPLHHKNPIEGLPLVCSVSPSMLEYQLYKVR